MKENQITEHLKLLKRLKEEHLNLLVVEVEEEPLKVELEEEVVVVEEVEEK